MILDYCQAYGHVLGLVSKSWRTYTREWIKKRYWKIELEGFLRLVTREAIASNRWNLFDYVFKWTSQEGKQVPYTEAVVKSLTKAGLKDRLAERGAELGALARAVSYRYLGCVVAETAAKHGNLSLLEWTIRLWTDRTYQHAASAKGPSLLQFMMACKLPAQLRKLMKISLARQGRCKLASSNVLEVVALKYAIQAGELETVRWITDQKIPVGVGAIATAAVAGQLEILEYLESIGVGGDALDHALLWNIVIADHPHVLEHMLKGRLVDSSLYLTAMINNSLKCLQWLERTEVHRQTDNNWFRGIMCQFYSLGVPMLDYLTSTGRVFDLSLPVEHWLRVNVESLEWLDRNGYQIPDRIALDALRIGTDAAVEWFLKRGYWRNQKMIELLRSLPRHTSPTWIKNLVTLLIAHGFKADYECCEFIMTRTPAEDIITLLLRSGCEWKVTQEEWEVYLRVKHIL